MVIPDSQDFDDAVVVLSSIVKLCCWTTTMIVVVAVKRGTNNLKQKLQMVNLGKIKKILIIIL